MYHCSYPSFHAERTPILQNLPPASQDDEDHSHSSRLPSSQPSAVRALLIGIPLCLIASWRLDMPLGSSRIVPVHLISTSGTDGSCFSRLLLAIPGAVGTGVVDIRIS